MDNKYTYNEALDRILNTKRNILVTGAGGTGKTTLIKDYIERTGSEDKILCATTGTAAVNIGGDTVHRVFGVPIPAYGARVASKQDRNVDILASADCVIIDEISMCTNAVFSFLWRVLKKAEKQKGDRIRLIVVGDFLQLPPVVTKNDQKYLKKFNLDTSGWCFACKEWNEAHFMPLELTEIKRQSEKEYIEQLCRLREGDSSSVDWFDRFVGSEVSETDDSIYICGTNAEAERINREKVEQIDSKPEYFEAVKTGRVSSAPMDTIISFKKGERVMFTVNSSIPGRYQNGLMGTVKKCLNEKNQKYVLVHTDNGQDIFAEYHTWHIYSYKARDGVLEKNETGTFSQIPLKPAYAITIHKSQGKTFNKAVISPKSFAPGQLYVALSRVRSSEGLSLTEPISSEDVIADQTALAFIKGDYKYALSEKKTKPAKKTSTAKKTSGRKKPATKKNTMRKISKKATGRTVKRATGHTSKKLVFKTAKKK